MLTKEQFIRDYYKSRENFDYVVKYDFSFLPDIIPTRKTTVTIVCLEEFSDGIVGECQTSYENLIGKKRDVLNYCSRKRRLTTEEFIEKAIEIQGEGVWDFSETVYIDKKHKIKVKCLKCGKTVKIWPDDLINKDNLDKKFFGCKDCVKKAIKEENRQENLKRFIQESKKRHGDAFDYSLVEESYIDSRHKVKIICNKCGRIFEQEPSWHIRSKTNECPKCVSEQIGISQRMSEEEFIKRGTEIYGDIFDYSELDYSGITKEVTVIDKRTGEKLTTTAENFLKGAKFGKNHSFLETSVYRWLEENKIEYKKEVYLKSDVFSSREFIRVDIEIENFNGVRYYIECNGEQHYRLKSAAYLSGKGNQSAEENYRNQVQRDSDLRKYCKENNIILIEIPYTFYTYNRIKDALVQILIEGKSPEEVIKQPEIEEIT